MRVEDYAQGRRFGNANGQAGSFGQSTGFGGFGQTNTSTAGGGLFGSQQNTATSGSTFGGFGNTAAPAANTTNAFGNSTTGGGLFGAKPASGGLFGNTASTGTATGGFGSTAGSTGGLFGGQNNQQQSNPFGGASTTNTGGGLFGSQQNTQQASTGFGASNTGGGLFGAQNNQQQQNKPAFGGFGQSGTTGGAFGGSTNTSGGLFGGQNNQQQSNLFGGSNANTGGGLFGAKPASGGLFGNTATNNTTTGGGLFGNNQSQGTASGGLFGNQNQAKPAGTGLFGSSTNTGTAGGGLFGGANNQQTNTGSSLFGGGNSGGSLFGNNQNKPAGTSLFGGNNTSNNGSSLFGGGNQQNQNHNAGSSLFGASNQGQPNSGSSLFGGTSQQQQQPNQLHASITGAPYGNEQLFSSLAAPSPPVGPLATPLNGARPQQKKTPSLMASMRLSTPVYSPRGNGSLGRTGGYGFSYSTYGTPTSAYSGSLTPGASSMLRPTSSFGSALTNKLDKSISMGNLRGDGTPGEGRPSLLRESALSPPGSAAGRYSSGSVRKLNIDRSLRTDLFAPSRGEESSRSRVSFDRTAEQPQESRREREPQPRADNALVRTEEEAEPEASLGLLRASALSNGAGRSQPEMSQIRGTNGALSSVPENGVAQRPASAPATQQRPAASKAVHGQEPPLLELGDYWTQPPLKDLKNMSRQQLQKLGKFVVGRDNTARIDFGAVDLSNVPLDDICGKIVKLELRNATVYADGSDKPPVGKGLNVPSTIWLEQSWPRAKATKKPVCLLEGPELKKHIGRLQKMEDTKLISYQPETGVWQFSVPHFTTYGLDDSDDDDAEGFTEQEQGDSSGLSEAPETPGQQEETIQSIETGAGEVDDTFEFKINRRSQVSVPGGFEEQGVSYDYDDPSADEEMEEEQHDERGNTETEEMHMMSGAVQPPSPGAVERYHSSMMEEDEPTGDFVADEEEDMQASPDMPGSFAPPEPKMPRSILKPSTSGLSAFASPEKLATESWEEQLQRTISPRKRDRQALRDVQQSAMNAKQQDDVTESPFKKSLFGQSAMGQSAFGQSYLETKSAKKAKTLAVGSEDFGKSQAFRTSMDIMNSLWASEKTAGKKAGAGGKGFEV